MECPTPDAQAIESAIDGLNFTKKQSRKFELSLAVRLVSRCEQLSSECQECRRLSGKTSEIISLLPQLPNDKTAGKSLRVILQEMEDHLRKAHKIVRPGGFIASWNVIGIFLGITLNAALHNPAYLALGISCWDSSSGPAQKAKRGKKTDCFETR